MRTMHEILSLNILREEMTKEEEVAFVNYWFDKYESEGFSKVFCSPFDLDYKQGSIRNGERFTVLNRVKAYSGDGKIKDGEADIETLPLWNIQFEDGYIMAAYPEEIIPSEIRNNIWRVSDKQYISQL